KSIVDKIRLVGEDGKALFFVDKDLAQMAVEESASVMTSAAV
ncbi:ferritin, partial [Shewanella sp. 0m-11]